VPLWGVDNFKKIHQNKGVKSLKEEHLKEFKIIGNNIRNLRKANEMTQEELGFLISSSGCYIGRLERTEKIPSLHTLLKIKKAFKCSLCDIFEGL